MADWKWTVRTRGDNSLDGPYASQFNVTFAVADGADGITTGTPIFDTPLLGQPAQPGPAILDPQEAETLGFFYENIIDWQDFAGQDAFRLRLEEPKLGSAATIEDFIQAGPPPFLLAEMDTHYPTDTGIRVYPSSTNIRSLGRSHLNQGDLIFGYSDANGDDEVVIYDPVANALNVWFTVPSYWAITGDRQTITGIDNTNDLVHWYDGGNGGALLGSSPSDFWDPALSTGVRTAMVDPNRKYAAVHLVPVTGDGNSTNFDRHIDVFDIENGFTKVSTFSVSGTILISSGMTIYDWNDDGTRFVGHMDSSDFSDADATIVLFDPTVGVVDGWSGRYSKYLGRSAANSSFIFGLGASVNTGDNTMWWDVQTDPNKVVFYDQMTFDLREEWVIIRPTSVMFGSTKPNRVIDVRIDSTTWFVFTNTQSDALTTEREEPTIWIGRGWVSRFEVRQIEIIYKGPCFDFAWDGTDYQYYLVQRISELNEWAIKKGLPGAVSVANTDASGDAQFEQMIIPGVNDFISATLSELTVPEKVLPPAPISLLPPEAFTLQIDTLTPTTISTAGGTEVRVDGSFSAQWPLIVTVDGVEPLDIKPASSMDSVFFFIAPPGSPGIVDLVVTQDTQTVTTTIEYV